MKNIMIGLCFLLFQLNAFTQKVFTEGVIQYDLSLKGSDNPKLAKALKGANTVVWFKSSHVRVDYNSSVLKQTTFFDAKDGSVVLLKESGAEKYMMNLTRSQWGSYNQKYEGISYQYFDETKTVAGFVCKKAVGKLKDGSQIQLYYCPDLMPYAPGYDYAFIEIPGLVLEYELSFGKTVGVFTATSIQTSPVSLSKFDLPTAGYKILEFKQ